MASAKRSGITCFPAVLHEASNGRTHWLTKALRSALMWETSRSIFCRKSNLCATLLWCYITSHFNSIFPFAAWFSLQFFEAVRISGLFFFRERTNSVWSIKCTVVWMWYNGFMMLALVPFSRRNTDHMWHQQRSFELKGAFKQHLNASGEFNCINRPWMLSLRVTTMTEMDEEQKKEEK